jgi:hypothetical protein
MLAMTTTDNAKAHGDHLRVPGSPGACHLIQAHWTPGRASVFTVTLAGRMPSCQSLSDALHSLP